MKQEKENVGSKGSENSRPQRHIGKRPRLLEAQRRKYDSVLHSTNGGATWPFSTPEGTWEVQARVQRLPLSEPFNLTFSFLFHGCGLRNSFTVISSAVRVRYNANAGPCSVARWL